jgi:hypothetical protein
MIGAGIVIWFSSVSLDRVWLVGFFVLAQFRTENRLTLFLELL